MSQHEWLHCSRKKPKRYREMTRQEHGLLKLVLEDIWANEKLGNALSKNKQPLPANPEALEYAAKLVKTSTKS